MNDSTSTSVRFSLAAIRERMASQRGRRFWRSLEELANTEGFQEYLKAEFPSLAPAWSHQIDRREMLKLIGASLALAGLTACSSPPPEKIVPYVHDPVGLVPGHPLFYATAMPLGGYGRGVLVESHMGRPTKIEGNPRHPASLGATDVFGQASILSLYDPDRSQAVTFEGRISSWTAFSAALGARLQGQVIKKGAGLRILTETITSPTLASQIQAVLERFPEAKWHQYEPDNADSTLAGSRQAFGQYVNTYYRLENADVILSLDSDFLNRGPAWLRYAREWSVRRQRESGPKGMNRLYAVESTPTSTGAVADHRLTLRAAEAEGVGRAIARAIGLDVAARPGEWQKNSKWVPAVAKDLQQHRGSCLVIAGDHQPPSLHALAHAMNDALGNVGSTVIYTDPVVAGPVDQRQSLRELAEEMAGGKVEILIILGGNPAFNSPVDFDFTEAIQRVPLPIHVGLYQDETAACCLWHVPETHYLESWSDIRAYDGTATIIQPLIAPLYSGRSLHEMLAVLQGNAGTSGYEIVKGYWQQQHSSADFADFWNSTLEAGVVPNTALPPQSAALKQDWFVAREQNRNADPSSVEIVFRPDPSIHDGRFANNGWLQELPKPFTRLTWDNAAIISPLMAERLGFDLGALSENRQKGTPAPMVELRYQGRSVQAPVLVLPGHPDNSVTVHLGYGRRRAGKVGSGHGFNAYVLRGSNAPWFDVGVEVRSLGASTYLATTQHHFTMAGGDLVRIATREDLEKNPNFIKDMGERPSSDETLYHPHEYPYTEYKWAMTVNLGSCVGCNACIVACNSENNIPVVGKSQTAWGREMHWLRIDHYYSGDLDYPMAHFEPVLCMQCENAPCELVCPVQATNHSSEGINQMVYNRCVGTRFCSNNCPYKVRRFNFLQYSDYITPSKEPLYNPDVTVRGRGVMEKCTYCIQRIQEAKINAAKEDRKVRDGEIVTACQQACPTRVFTFGDLNDPNGAVSRSAAEPLNYGLLTDLNTRPRTTYLAKLRNPNPELEQGGSK